MKLTRAQIVGLYGLAMNMPVDTEFNIIDFDDYGDAIVSATSWENGAEARFKLKNAGGTESLGTVILGA